MNRPQGVAPPGAAVFGGELAFERVGRADAAGADHERFIGGEAFGLQYGDGIAQMGFEFVEVLGAEVRRLPELSRASWEGDVQVERD